MTVQLILPLSQQSSHDGYSKADEECTALVSEWIEARTKLVREVWSQSPSTTKTYISSSPSALADEVIEILSHRVFNFQSKINLIPLLPRVRQNLVRQLSKGTPIKIFLLYNGGYRASSFLDKLSLIFEPDQTELMLLYQIALLNKKICSIYDPGIDFIIVVNNGVAHWVNDIPLVATENYANQLRTIIESLGAAGSIRVLVQSELVGYDSRFSFEPFQPQTFLSEKDHKIVERFLGRGCSQEEAKYRSALYPLCEAKWGEEISSMASAKDILIMRQVAHPDMLSFRPFPGGAIRIQNGSFGFQYLNNKLTPKLITSESVKQYGMKWVPYSFPWSIDYKRINAVKLSDAFGPNLA
jgi:hypothetical protein